MDVSVYLALGGIAGSALKAFVSNDQVTLSRKSIADVLLGGAVGVLLPLFPVIPIPKDASVLQQAALVGAVAYLAGDVLVNLFQKLTGVDKLSTK
jgi:uncharacterized membrane protein YraQ (UPF0718 family)